MDKYLRRANLPKRKIIIKVLEEGLHYKSTIIYKQIGQSAPIGGTPRITNPGKRE